MFYFGMTTSWNENWNVLRTSNTTEKTADQQYHRLPESKCSSWISVAYVSPAQYYVGKTGWAGVQMESTAEAGCLYSVYNDGSDKIYKNVVAEGGAIPHFSTTMVNKTVGTTDSEIAATAETSIYGNEQVLFYYYTTDGGTTFTKFDPSDISSLAVGVYTVYALGWDGHILVRSDNSVTLNVGVAISLNANGGTDGDVTSVFATSGAAARGWAQGRQTLRPVVDSSRADAASIVFRKSSTRAGGGASLTSPSVMYGVGADGAVFRRTGWI